MTRRHHAGPGAPGRPTPGASRATRRLTPVPGVIKIRLSGDQADISCAAELLAEAGAEVLDASGPGPNRYDPAVRVYLAIRLPARENR